MSGLVGEEGAGSLSSGAGRLDERKMGLNDKFQALMNDLDRDQNVLRGAALKEFRDGQAELVVAFKALTDWCSKYGVNLNLGQAKIDQTDVDSQEQYAEATRELSTFYLSRSPQG